MKNKFLRVFVMSALFCLALALPVFAAEGGADASSIITTAIGDIASTLMSILGVVVAGITGFFAAKIGITKGIAFIKTMVGKA